MNRRSRMKVKADEWPAGLRWIINAARHECPRGHADALEELMTLALVMVPSRGLLDPTTRGDHELFAAFETIGRRHLGMAAARASWRGALRGAQVELQARDRIEAAALRVQGVSDTAYFYAGLTFGLVWGVMDRTRG